MNFLENFTFLNSSNYTKIMTKFGYFNHGNCKAVDGETKAQISGCFRRCYLSSMQIEAWFTDHISIDLYYVDTYKVCALYYVI